MFNIFSILEREGFPVQKAGHFYRMGICPACGGGRRDKLVIWPEARGGKASWYCHACGHSGDGVDLLQGLCGMEWREAYETLTGRHPPEKTGKATGNPQASFPNRQKGVVVKPTPMPTSQWSRQANDFLHSLDCLEAMDETDRDRAITKERGIRSDFAGRIGLRWNPRDRYPSEDEWGVQEGTGRKLCIPRGIVMPVVRQGTIAALQVRCDKESKGKLRWVRGGLPRPFILGRPLRPVVIFESILDAILCYQEGHGQFSVLATCGAGGCLDDAARQFLDNAEPYLFMWPDADEAGQAALERWRITYPWLGAFQVPQHRDGTPIAKDATGLVKARLTDLGLPTVNELLRAWGLVHE